MVERQSAKPPDPGPARAALSCAGQIPAPAARKAWTPNGNRHRSPTTVPILERSHRCFPRSRFHEPRKACPPQPTPGAAVPPPPVRLSKTSFSYFCDRIERANGKSEIRRPKETRSPKSETGLSTDSKLEFRLSLGFRPSDFGLLRPPAPLKT